MLEAVVKSHLQVKVTMSTLQPVLSHPIAPPSPVIAATLRSCGHDRKQTHHCNSPYCPACSHWKAQGECSLLRQRLPVSRGTNLFATLKVESIPTNEIRSTARSLIAGWNSLVNNRAQVNGWFRWLEITADEHRPWLENMHVHGILTMGLAYSGRNYISSAGWEDLWRESIGSSYTSAQVEEIREPLAGP